MRNLLIYLSALSSLSYDVRALHHSAAQLRDLMAYPKYEVSFLTELPLSASDADKAKVLGVEREEEWLNAKLLLGEKRRLSDGSTKVPTEERLEIQPMTLKPPGSTSNADYLCLMPSANSTAAQTALSEEADEHDEVDPVQSWAALSHLDGKCLYLKQGWFTYSYCHNSHIRQFRAAPHAHPHPPGGWEPEEDTTFEAYTLGQAQRSFPTANRPKHPSRHTPNSPEAVSNSVAFDHGASSRYLLQRWSEGDLCDKTGRPRDIEIQIHCSMTSTDSIYLIKELAICSYVMIIHSPHLCSLPGFRAPQVDVEAAGIRCRQVISDDDFAKWMKRGDGVEGERMTTDALRLPWIRPKQDSPHVGSAPPASENELPPGSFRIAGTDEIVFLPELEGSDLDEAGNQAIVELFQQAFGAMQDRHSQQENANGPLGDDAGPEEEQMILLSLIEDEDGNVDVEADVMLEGTNGGQGRPMGKEDKAILMDMVRQYLEEKTSTGGKDEEEGQTRATADGKGLRDEL